MPNWYQEETGRALRAVFIVILHTVVVAVIVSCMWGTQKLIIWYWGSGEPIFIGQPLHEITFAAELVVLVVFFGAATIRAALAFWR
jgi:hypothetical protein